MSLINFLQKTYIYSISKRFLGKRRYVWKDEGIKYPGFSYYPRNADFEDPPFEAPKLFRVQRIKSLKGTPYWEKDILRKMKLDGKTSDIVIIKNIPENNARLWRVKHLIQIQPITFPDGFPTSSEGTFLKENGELVVKKEIRPVPEKLIATKEFQNNPKKLDNDTIRRNLRQKWLSGW